MMLLKLNPKHESPLINQKTLTKIEIKKKTKPQTKVCEECGDNFMRNCDFENHLESHNVEKKFGCDMCANKFFLKWRLEKTQ